MSKNLTPSPESSDCSRHECSGPASLPKSVEEVWKKGGVVILCDVYLSLVHEIFCTHIVYLYSSVKLSSC
jgi:hypothetical protein